MQKRWRWYGGGDRGLVRRSGLENKKESCRLKGGAESCMT